MDVNTSRADMLPEMLKAILDGERPGDAGSPPARSGGCRALLPTDVRAKVARVLPERVALDLTARLELRGVDWSRTRAFAHPAENQGYVRLNLRGRERDGIVAPEDADALLDEITAGCSRSSISTASRRSRRSSASPTRSSPSAVAPNCSRIWSSAGPTVPRRGFTGVRSDQFGTVHRHGVGSGRPGNHTEGDAWALVVPGTVEAAGRPRDRPGWRTSPPPRPRWRASNVDGVSGEPLLQLPGARPVGLAARPTAVATWVISDEEARSPRPRRTPRRNRRA